MPRLSEILSGVLHEIIRTKTEIDKVSIQLAREYSNDKILKSFPVPHIDINHVEIDLKFAFSKGSGVEGEIIIDHEKLKGLPQTSITTMRFVLSLEDYNWLEERSEGKAVLKSIKRSN